MLEIKKTIVIDGTNHLLGRLGSKVAKMLIEGNRVVVINSEKILLSGNRKSVMGEYLSRLEISSRVNPIYGPFHPKRPETIVSKAIRGMLPMRKSKGTLAFKRLRVYFSVPTEFEKSEKITFQEAMANKPLSYYVKVGEISKLLGREVTE